MHVDEQLCVDAEHLVEQLFVVVFARLADGAFCNVAHGVDTDGLELFGVTPSNAPKIRQRTVRPELPAVAHFVKLRDADASLSGWTCFAIMSMATLQR